MAARSKTPELREIVDSDWICTRYSVTPRYVRRRIEEGDLKPFKVGNRLNRFYLDEVVRFMERDRLGAAK